MNAVEAFLGNGDFPFLRNAWNLDLKYGIDLISILGAIGLIVKKQGGF